MKENKLRKYKLVADVGDWKKGHIFYLDEDGYFCPAGEPHFFFFPPRGTKAKDWFEFVHPDKSPN